METKEFARFFDHTALKAETTNDDIVKLTEEAKELGVKAVCVNPIWIPLAAKRLESSAVLPITVVGFPLGAMTTPTKVFEAREAIAAGAQEIDMVLSIGRFKSGDLDYARRDIYELLKACQDIPLKVIFETCYLNAAEITQVTCWCAEEGVAFVKTSTGFGSRGASLEDIRLMGDAIASVKGSQTKIKASGGIRTLDDTLKMIDAGASRIGASATKQILAAFSGGTNVHIPSNSQY